MSDDRIYFVKRDARTNEGKDTPYLMAYQPSGCMELMANGKLQQVYTCVWGNHIYDAMPFEDRELAKAMADRIGNCVVISERRISE